MSTSSSKLLLSALATFAVVLPLASADAAERPGRGKRGDGNRPAVTKTTGTSTSWKKPGATRPSVTKPTVTKPVVAKPVVTKPPVTVTPRPVVNKPVPYGNTHAGSSRNHDDGHGYRQHHRNVYPWGLRGVRWLKDADDDRPSHHRRKRWWSRSWR